MNAQPSTELWGFAYLDHEGNRVEIISTSREDGDRQIREHAIRMSQREARQLRPERQRDGCVCEQ